MARPKFREWIRQLGEDVIQGEYGFEPGEFAVYPDHWRPLFREGLTPQQAWQRAMDAHRAQREADDRAKAENWARIQREEAAYRTRPHRRPNMTDRDRDVRERCAEIARSLKSRTDGPVRADWQLGYAAACREIEELIRALDLPLTSAREVTDVEIEAGARALCASTGLIIDGFRPCSVYSEEAREKWRDEAKRLSRACLQAALASAPQPACVGVGEADHEKIDGLIGLWSMRPAPDSPEGRAWEAGAKQGWNWGRTLSPAPSPQAGVTDEQLYRLFYGNGDNRDPKLIRQMLAHLGLQILSARREG